MSTTNHQRIAAILDADDRPTVPLHVPVLDELVPAPVVAVTSRLPNLPLEFWEQRPVLAHIRQAAHSRGRSADLVFAATLARLSSMVSHELQFNTGLGEVPRCSRTTIQ
jgi:hypothetical protein